MIAHKGKQRILADMATLLVRELDSDLVRLLKERAHRNHRSAEAEHRAILDAALRPVGVTTWQEATALRDETRGRGGEDGADIIRRLRDARSQSPKP